MIYLSVYMHYGAPTICSKHKTFYAADDAANKCEISGGVHHDVWEVTVYKRKKKKTTKKDDS